MSRTSKPKPVRIPSYCLHKPTGQAYVTLGGKMVYLGKYKLTADGEPDCPQYHKLIGDWLANNRTLPVATATECTSVVAALTVVELMAKYWGHVVAYYRGPDGTPTGEQEAIRHALKPLKKLFGGTPAGEFGPKRLKLVRDEMRGMGWCRTNINRQLSRVKQCFRWGVEEELVPPSVDHALRAVKSLRRNPQEVRESAKVLPAPGPAIDAVLPLVSTPVAAMIKLQRLTGMRSGEVVKMRTCDIERTEENGAERWTYKPAHHKTEHHGIIREIPLGPQARDIIRPFLTMKLDAFLFSPADAAPHAGERYTVASYRRAVARGCDLAFVLPAEMEADWKEVCEWVNKQAYARGRPPKVATYPADLRAKRDAVEAFRAGNRWHPHQLRHNAATTLRKRFGLEDARVVLGHESADMTADYAEKDRDRAREIMEQAG